MLPDLYYNAMILGDTLLDDDEAERERLTELDQAWKAYHGAFEKPLRKTGGFDPNIVLPKSGEIVDIGVSFLFGDDLEFTIDDTIEETTPEEQYIEDVFDANKKMSFLQGIGLNGAIGRNAFIKIVPNAPSTAPFPRLVNLDPGIVKPYWSEDDVEDVYMYRLQWRAMQAVNSGGRVERRAVTKREVIERIGAGATATWTITSYISTNGANRWQQVGSPMPWRYPFAPIVHCQNLINPNQFWGKGDLEAPIVALNAALNVILSDMNSANHKYGHPIPWGKLVSADTLDTAIGKMVRIANPDGEVGLLQAAGLTEGPLSFYRLVDELLHEVAMLPAVATGKVENVGQLSGLALKILYGPLVKLTEKKQITYGDMLKELCRRLLILAGTTDPPSVEIVWPEVVPSDPLSERQAYVIDKQLGASERTILQKLGYNPDQEQAQASAEADAAMARQQQAMQQQGGFQNGSQTQGQQQG